MATQNNGLKRLRTASGAVVLAIGLGLFASCSRSTTAPRADVKEIAPEADLAVHQAELLDIAFAAASSLPLDPHIKSRARAQDQVATACLAIGSLSRARAFAEVIPNWRRGSVAAEIAESLARAGRLEDARQTVLDAELVIESGVAANDLQEWRKERVRAKAARVRLLLGEEPAAARLLTGIAPAEAARIESVRAERLPADGLDARVVELRRILEVGDLDAVGHAVDAALVLLRRFAGDPKCAALEGLLDTGLAKTPLLVQLDVLLRRATAAVEAGNRERALGFADRATELVWAQDWLPEHRIPTLARIAAVRHRAGAEARARNDFDAVVGMYEAEERKIQGFDRAEVLVPVAEAARALGDDARALVLYRRALDEGTRNPNGRPRAEDLVAICLSLATMGLEPDPELRARLLGARDGLGAPW